MPRRGWIVGSLVVAGVAGLVALAFLVERAARIEWPANPQITLRVVRSDGAPAANARVDVGALRARPHGQPFHPNRFLERPLVDPEPTVSFTTGAEGTISLPWHWAEFGDVPISARLDADWGEVVIAAAEPHGSMHELRIGPDTRLEVRVLTADGSPAANVETRVYGTIRGSNGAEGSNLWLAAAHTDAAGTATFVHAQHWMQHLAPRGTQRPFEVRTYMAAPLAAKLDGADLPHEPVELRLPATGRVEIVTVDEGGAPLHENVFIVILAIGDDIVNFGLLPAHPDAVVLPHMPLGRTWNAWMPGITGLQEFEGPKQAGETVRITLRATAPPVLTGRLVMGQAPVAGAAVKLTEADEPLGKGHSDALGRFVVRYESLWAGLHGNIDFAARTAAGEALTGRFRGRLRRQGNTHDVGDVQLAPPMPAPVMLAGRIFAPRGLESLRIGVHQDLGDSRESLDPDVTLRPDGTFVVHGPDPGTPLWLSLASRDHEEKEPIRFRHGTTDREIALTPLVTLHVPFVVASRELAQCLEFELQEDGERATQAPKRKTWSDDGTMTCTWRATETGAHTVTVRRRSGGTPIATAAVDLYGDEHGECHVPKVTVPAIRVLRIEVPAPGAADAWPPSVVELQGEKRVRSPVLDDTTWLLASDAPVDLFVDVPEHRSVTLRGVDGDTTVELQPGIAVDLDLELPELAAGEKLELTLSGDDSDRHHAADIRGKRGKARLPAPGTYFLIAEAWPKSRTFDCEPREIVVGEDGGTFRIAVRDAPR